MEAIPENRKKIIIKDAEQINHENLYIHFLKNDTKYLIKN